MAGPGRHTRFWLRVREYSKRPDTSGGQSSSSGGGSSTSAPVAKHGNLSHEPPMAEQSALTAHVATFASAGTAGHIKIGDGLTIDPETGIASVTVGGGASDFLDLTDVLPGVDPKSYEGAEGFLVVVNGAATGLEFIDGATLFDPVGTATAALAAHALEADPHAVYAFDSHVHDATAITTGTLQETQGGTGRGVLVVNTFLYADTTTTFAAAPVTVFARSILDDPDAATARATLGLTAGGDGDVWVEKAGDTMSGNLRVNAMIGVGVSPSVYIHVKQDHDNVTDVVFENQHAGTAAQVRLSLRNGPSSLDGLTVGVLGTLFTTNGAFVQDSAYLSAESNLAGLSIIARGSTGYIRLYTGGFADGNLRQAITSTGLVDFYSSQVTVRGSLAVSTTGSETSAFHFHVKQPATVINLLESTTANGVVTLGLYQNDGTAARRRGYALTLDASGNLVIGKRTANADTTVGVWSNSTGYLGIGTNTTPQAPLHLYSAGAENLIVFGQGLAVDERAGLFHFNAAANGTLTANVFWQGHDWGTFSVMPNGGSFLVGAPTTISAAANITGLLTLSGGTYITRGSTPVAHIAGTTQLLRLEATNVAGNVFVTFDYNNVGGNYGNIQMRASTLVIQAGNFGGKIQLTPYNGGTYSATLGLVIETTGSLSVGGTGAGLTLNDTSSSSNPRVNFSSNGTLKAVTGFDIVGGIYTVGTVSTDPWRIITNSNERVRVLGTSPTMYLGATANSKMSAGLTINQGTNDDEIFALQSGDVAHGITDIADTNTFLSIGKSEAAGGGYIKGFTPGTYALFMTAFVTLEDTAAKTVNSLGAFVINTQKKSGTGITALSTNANLFVIRNNNSTKVIVDADGDTFQDGTGWTNFDSYDDPTLLHDLSLAVSRADDPIRQQFSGFLKYNRDALESTGLVQFNPNGHHFVNMSRLTMLHTGAIRQVYDKLVSIAARLSTLERMISR